MTTKFVNFRETVANATRQVFADNTPVTGNITDILVHFPPGSSALVQVAVFVRGKQVLPKEAYLAMDDTTQHFPLVEQITLGDRIEVDIRNTDNVFSHTISVVITCEGEVGAMEPI